MFAWTIALLELMVSGYSLVLNSKQGINRNLAGFLLLLAINSAATGALLSSTTIAEAKIPAILLAVSTPMIQPILLSTSICLFRQNWQRSRLRWLVASGYLLATVPILTTVYDLITNQGLWISGLEAANYQGGYLPLIAYTQGSLSDFIWLTSVSGAGILVLLSLLYLINFDAQVFPSARRLGWLLFAAQSVGIGLNIGLHQYLYPVLPPLLTNLLLAITFSYVSFRQLVSERHLQRGHLQVRLTILMIIVTVPILGSVLVFITSQAAQRIEQNAIQQLQLDNQHLAASLDLWLEGEVRAYQNILANLSGTSEEATPILKALVSNNPELNQVVITALDGSVTASAGGKQLTNIADQKWFTQLKSETRIIAEIWDHPYFSSPVLLLALPMSDSAGNLKEVGIFFYSINALSEKFLSGTGNPSSEAYVLDHSNRAILTNRPSVIQLGGDGSSLLAVGETNPGTAGGIQFLTADGDLYHASVTSTTQGWRVINQKSNALLLAPAIFLRRSSWVMLTAGLFVILLLVWVTIRNSLHPITSLTLIADNITTGNLTRTVPVESEDELGNLARSMNNMIAQMRGLITNLEQRVAERTQDIERRAVQLQVTAEVASESASIRELERLMDSTVHLISTKFGFYHSGIFLIDDQGEYAVLRAASSDGGRRMLARGHKLRVGQTGIVGYVAEKGESRIALDVGRDAVYFNNPDLPQTRSEAALPLKVYGKVIGVLDVQSPQAEAFKTEDIQVLEVLSDQIALAIDNARLFDENSKALSELQSLYQAQIQKTWQNRLEDRSITYVYDRLDVQPAKGVEGNIDFGNLIDPYIIEAPIELRGWKLGNLILKREPDQAPWSKQDRMLLQESAQQIALALDNARLLETVQRNAYHEQVIGQIAAKAQSSLVLEHVMKTAVQEIGQAIQASRVQIRLHRGNGKQPTDQEEVRPNSLGATQND